MKSKQYLTFKIIALILLVSCLSSCEKHDGIEYFKSKCTAELNGQRLIDQTPFDLSPNATKTPYISAFEHVVEFTTFLSESRNEMPIYVVTINIFVEEPWNYLTNTQNIEKVIIPGESKDETWEYVRYCVENKVSYATILCTEPSVTNEIVEEGFFQIASYNKEKNQYSGTFSLKFSRGILNGEFAINP